MRSRWLLSAIVASIAAAPPATAEILTRWVQHTATDIEARFVTDQATCPPVTIDGRDMPTSERAPPSPGFPARVCSILLPGQTRSALLDSQALPLPKTAPQRLIVVGDTGCRDDERQTCDLVSWPWRQVAVSAAAMKPDLVIHVGDYYYRDRPCADGRPACDKWPLWDEDFFAPARPLLAAAPWVMVRGNHEECTRAGLGWTNLLAPAARSAPCMEHEPPYTVNIGGRTLAVLDTAIARDQRTEPAVVDLYRGDFAALARLASQPSWLLTHHALRGVVRIGDGRMIGGNLTLMAAQNELPSSIELMLSGHIHTFEILNYRSGPPQIIAGNGGDLLDRQVPPLLAGFTVGDLQVTDGISAINFGFLLLERGGADWSATAFDLHGKPLRRCTIANRQVLCP